MTDPARRLDAAGSPFERGLDLGKAWAGEIATHLDRLGEALARQGVAQPDDYLGRMVRETGFQAAIARHCPHLLDEVRGMAEGAGAPFERVYALQLLDEEWAYRRTHAAPAKREKCSSFAVRDPVAGATWIGQNMDIGGYTDGLQWAVRHAAYEDRPGALVFTVAGLLGLMGVNAAGVGLCVNSLPQLPSRTDGLPVAFVVRRLLEARSAREAREMCLSMPHATNQHYLIADPDEIVSLEASADGVSVYAPPTSDRVLHTNHPLADHPQIETLDETNSRTRLGSLQARLGQAAPTVQVLQAALSAFDDPAHPVCRVRSDTPGNINFTAGSMISRLGTAPASWISYGPPGERPYVAFSDV